MRVFYDGWGIAGFWNGTNKSPEASKVSGFLYLTEHDSHRYNHIGRTRIEVLLYREGEIKGDSFALLITDQDGVPAPMKIEKGMDTYDFYCGNALRIFVNEDDAPLKPQSESQKSKERNNMLKLIYGMARHAYQYDPDSQRNTATGGNKNSISATISEYGIDISDDTIRKFLKEAKSLID